MKKMLRNVTLSAAALAALVTFAPKAAADFPLPPSPREVRAMWYRRHGGWHVRYGHRYFVPAGYSYSYPHYRVYAGHRFYRVRPGPGYVYVRNYGWCAPPYAGATWVPGHYGHGGVWVEARFR